MKFFVDTAKIEDIKKANEMGVICGVTTNPSLIAKEGGRSQEDVLKEIASIFPAPNFCEVRTVKPAVSPIRKPMIRNMIVPVEPTAASPFVPTNFPTIMASAML